MIKIFKGKKQVFNYIKQLFSKYKIIFKGSSVKKELNDFSDIDVEIYGKTRVPYYELVFVGKKLVLITVYFYKDENNKPKKDKYNQKQRTIRECQLAIDFMFKYLRHKNKKYLESVIKRLK